MSDDAKKPERWDLPDVGLDWEEQTRRHARSLETHAKDMSDPDPAVSSLAKIEYGIQWSALVAYLLTRAMLSAQARITVLEAELATATGRPPPPAPEPQDYRLLRAVLESVSEGVTRGGLKNVGMPDLFG